ncbi:MAG: ABC transporter permease [Bacillota bacterium]|nr:MAG: ABC transporter permease [Bacillota bacterium]
MGSRAFQRAIWVYVGLAYLFIFSPLVTTAAFSFNEDRFASLPWRGFTLKWYRQLLASSALVDALINSVVVGLAVGVTAAVLGFLGAYGLHRLLGGRVSGLLSMVLLSPLAVPWLLLGLGLLIFLNSLGVPRSLASVWIGHSVFAIPLAVMVIQSRLATLPQRLEEAALDLGAGRLQALRYVVLPLSLPGVAAAFLLSFTLSFDEFIMAWFLTSFDVTLPVQIWTMVRSGINPTINAVGALVFVFSITLTVVAQWLLTARREAA